MTVLFWGSETLTPTTTANTQGFPNVAALADGGFLVSFEDFSAGVYQIRARRFAADGTPVANPVSGNPGDFLVEAAAGQDSAAAGLSGGGYVVVYEDLVAENNVRARVFGADGTPLGAAFQVNTASDYSQQNPSVAPLAGGGFVVVWGDISNLAGGTNFDIRARLFDSTGNAVTNLVTADANDFLVNVNRSAVQNFPDVAGLAGGGFVVVYEDNSDPVTGSDIKARLFTGAGGAAGAEFTVNSVTASGQQKAAVAALTDGGFAVAWEDAGDGTSSFNIRVRRFDAGGTVQTVQGSTGDYLVNTTTSAEQIHVDIAAAPGGGFLVTWQDQSLTAPDASGSIRGQLFDGAGNTVGTEFLINTIISSAQSYPAAMMLEDGRIVVAWNDFNQDRLGGDPDGAAVRHQILDPRDGIVNGSADADTLYGHDLLSDIITAGAGGDGLFGLAGNDTLSGGAGADTLTGGSGNDTYVDPEGDVIVEAPGQGTDTVTTSVAFTLPANVERLFLQGTAAVAGTGNDLANTINGNTANNTLSGLAGNDTLAGAAGADTLSGGAGADRLTGGTQRDKLIPGVDSDPDTLVFALLNDSTGVTRDVITRADFNAEDRIDLPSLPTAIAPLIAAGPLSTATFNANLAAAVTAAALPAGQAVLFDPNAGDLDQPGMVYLVVDANGIAGYQANQDWVFQLETCTGSLDPSDFV